MVDHNDKTKLQAIVGMAAAYGDVQGSHHKQWLIDQMVRVALGEKYKNFIKSVEDWDTGIAP